MISDGYTSRQCGLSNQGFKISYKSARRTANSSVGLEFELRSLTICLVDTDFPASESSLYTNVTRPPKDWPKVTEWKRVTQITPKAQLFVNGVEAGDVIQGVLGMYDLDST